VALTLSGATNNEDCNDTFYGCVNWSTGKFQVEIPEDCCIEYGEDCSFCEPGKTPLTINLNYVEGTLCDGCYFNPSFSAYWKFLPPSKSGEYILTQNGTNPCQWLYTEDHFGSAVILQSSGLPDCSNPGSYTGYRFEIQVSRYYRYYPSPTITILDVGIKLWTDNLAFNYWIFYGSIEYNLTDPCIGEHEISNEFSCDWATGRSGGIVTVNG
jgi:hypothetical protein